MSQNISRYDLPTIEAEQVLIIPGRLAGRNEAERAARTSWRAGANLKKDETLRVAGEIMAQRIKPVLYGKATITLIFYEPNARRDADNVIAGSKYILDALKDRLIIRDDGQKHIELITEPVQVDTRRPRIEVKIVGQIWDCSRMQNRN